MTRIAIVDFALGNLYSVRSACARAGAEALTTSDPREIERADAVILPGVGAFGDAMDALRRLDLVAPLRDAVASGKPLMGVCLGIQLLLGESSEFGRHEGLGLVAGKVVPFDHPREGDRELKVPQICWNRIRPPAGPESWRGTPLDGIAPGESMYFIHSYFAKPDDAGVVLSTTRYGHIEFCSSLKRGNVFACQFHPERSGQAGLKVYQNFVGQAKERKA